ncbi:hypothetical protein J5N97_019809 [Dioscorea zingiberensis]|uniref:Uncharacterized protein n=1 Tax=Dioscorea zingiberensis TaxID=325984 RepID=A0A9D5HD24_9LILI|nr:hypothetical protein J5N97_019809 [Dioscorea zingiberensis]
MESVLLRFFTSLVFISFFLLSSGDQYLANNNISIHSLDTFVRDCAFETLAHRRRTSIIYQLPLPMNLSGIKASAVRLRGRTLWRLGVDIGAIHLHSGAISKPPVRRLTIVYQSFGNRSSTIFHTPSGFSLIAPVVGFHAYDASDISSNTNITELDLNVTRTPINVSFPKVILPKGMSGSKIRCANFGLNGTVVSIYKMESSNVCLTRTTGHFGIIVESEVPGELTPKRKGRDGMKWRVWLMVCAACGVVGLFFVGLFGVVGFRLARNKKMKEIERRGENDEALGSVWVGRSKMPNAAMVRTQPVLETESTPQV